MKIGLIGCGSMGKVHTYVVKTLPLYYQSLPFRADIAGVCAAHEDSAREYAIAQGIRHVYLDVDEMVADSAIDVIDICTPNVYHYETIIKALQAGKAVYCEKPLCVTPLQAEEVAALAFEKGIPSQIVFNYRFMTPVMRAKELISEGRIGKILSFDFRYLHSSCLDPNKPAGWKQDSSLCGGGVLFDLGSHVLDLCTHLCGPVASISGTSQIAFPVRKGCDGKPWNTNGDEAFYMTLKLKNGAVGQVAVSKLAMGTADDLTFSVYGEKGSLSFSLMEPEWLNFYDGDRVGGDLGGERGFVRIECGGRYPAPGGLFPSPKAPVGWLRGHVGSMYAFLSSVHEGSTCSPSFEDGAYVQRLMDAAYLSDFEGGLYIDPEADE